MFKCFCLAIFGAFLCTSCAMDCQELASVYRDFSFEGEVLSKGLGKNSHGLHFVNLSGGYKITIEPSMENQWALYGIIRPGDRVQKSAGTEYVYRYYGTNQKDSLPYYWECR